MCAQYQCLQGKELEKAYCKHMQPEYMYFGEKTIDILKKATVDNECSKNPSELAKLLTIGYTEYICKNSSNMACNVTKMSYDRFFKNAQEVSKKICTKKE